MTANSKVASKGEKKSNSSSTSSSTTTAAATIKRLCYLEVVDDAKDCF